MTSNPLLELASLGQSVWLDYIDRRILSDGTLDGLIQNDRLAGLTSNPAIFENAISHGVAYSNAIARLVRKGMRVGDLYQQLVVDDIGRAADRFMPVYESSGGRDGFVSIEVSPLLARDAAATLIEARKLWSVLGRPNIMIKVPGTREAIPVIGRLLREGINVNVTLLFSVGRYVEVLGAYMNALEARQSAGLPLAGIASVASFFLSRIDVKVDAALDLWASKGDIDAAAAHALRGQAAIASAGFAYRRFQQSISEPRWRALQAAGAMTQRLLWASTGTKDPQYSNVKYVEALVAADTVNTLPLETLAAYRDHGRPVARIDEAIQSGSAVMHRLTQLGIDMHEIDNSLEQEGIEKFIKPYQSVLHALQSFGASA